MYVGASAFCKKKHSNLQEKSNIATFFENNKLGFEPDFNEWPDYSDSAILKEFTF